MGTQSRNIIVIKLKPLLSEKCWSGYKQVGMKKNDFLRQVVGYEYPNNPWEKDNYKIKEEYRNVVMELLDELNRGAKEE